MMELTTVMQNLWQGVLDSVVPITQAIVLLVVGYIVGRIAGRAVKEVLVRANVDEYIKKEEHLSFKASSVFDTVTRWLIYLVVIAGAVKILQVPFISRALSDLLGFLGPMLIGVVILIVAYGVAIYIKNEIVGKETAYADLTGKVILYFMVLIGLAAALEVGLPQVRIVDYLVLIIVGSVGLGTAIALGFGLKDVVKDMAKDYAEEFRKKRKKR